ncbi:MAG: winged helix-turn-helix transcriptional regulator [Alphaproteobacteria bacterium]|nr:winged helix-turn-helix domain-containing protein [Alphaproteobacteria bacterium]MDE2336905.1 winged helix-turn-helix transcriptional regulator [Alphaproteobacteria bacterium]
MDAFSALADSTRRNIIEMLAASGQLSAGDICRHFDSSPPAISQHLKVLRAAKLVRMEKNAQQRIYSINPAAFDDMEAWIVQMRRFWNERFDALDALLKEEVKKSHKIKGARNGRKK